MLKGNIEEQCRRISSDKRGGTSACTFAPRGALGFIDTSGAHDGTRGIAFFADRMCVNLDGVIHEIEYKDISGVKIISSFEDAFADELSIAYKNTELRISDYSLDKFELKQLLDGLCTEQRELLARHARQVEEYSELIAQKLADNIQNHIPEYAEHPVIAEVVVDIPEERLPLPKDYAPAPIPEERIDWISGGAKQNAEEKPPAPIPEEKPAPKRPAVMSGVIDRVPVIGEHKPTYSSKGHEETKPPVTDPTAAFERTSEKSDGEFREELENMSSDEMMTFLTETLNDINDTSEPFFEQTENAKAEYSDGAFEQPETSEQKEEPIAESPAENPHKYKTLTREPIWGDIYIKASKSLRELCEDGKLTMEQIETELKAHLLDAAQAFEEITSNDAKVPKVMMPKITELKAAADNFESYFSCGEDVAVRAMFFMMYQMLSYADRIEESPETKSRLNDFFRRFGPAGIMLSMLDMRV